VHHFLPRLRWRPDKWQWLSCCLVISFIWLRSNLTWDWKEWEHDKSTSLHEEDMGKQDLDKNCCFRPWCVTFYSLLFVHSFISASGSISVSYREKDSNEWTQDRQTDRIMFILLHFLGGIIIRPSSCDSFPSSCDSFPPAMQLFLSCESNSRGKSESERHVFNPNGMQTFLTSILLTKFFFF